MFIIKKVFLSVVLFFCIFTVSQAKEPNYGVNKYAWEASLNTINFMPLVSANISSGVIITDWYAVNNVRYKLNVRVLNGILNGTSVTVSVFKQTKSNNLWKDENVSLDIANKLEETILNEAKKLRNVDISRH